MGVRTPRPCVPGAGERGRRAPECDPRASGVVTLSPSALNARYDDSQQWMDSRSRLRRRLDAIRSQGWSEHHLEMDERRIAYERLTPGNTGLAEDGTLLRNGPWYADDGEMALRADEAYEFEAAIAAHKRALADAALVGSAIGRSGADRPRPGKPSTAASPARHTNETGVQPAKSRGAAEEGARLSTAKVSGSPWVSVRRPRQMVLLHASGEFGSRRRSTP